MDLILILLLLLLLLGGVAVNHLLFIVLSWSSSCSLSAACDE